MRHFTRLTQYYGTAAMQQYQKYHLTIIQKIISISLIINEQVYALKLTGVPYRTLCEFCWTNLNEGESGQINALTAFNIKRTVKVFAWILSVTKANWWSELKTASDLVKQMVNLSQNRARLPWRNNRFSFNKPPDVLSNSALGFN